MASDEIVWQIIGQTHCSFKLKTTKNQTFCREPHNVTGFCNRQSCPLANSRYATIRSNPDTGVLYLYMKTIERSHLPSRLWQRIRLPSIYAKALEMVDESLMYWPKFLVHKCKQRLTRLTQVAIRMRRLEKEDERLGEKIVPRLAPKVRRREEVRERKAENAAKVERAIERELVERLRSGAYGEHPLNVDEGIWEKVLRGLEKAGEGMRDKDMDDGIDEEAEKEVEYEDGNVEYVSDIAGQSEDEDDVDDFEDWQGGVDVNHGCENGNYGEEAREQSCGGADEPVTRKDDKNDIGLKNLLGSLNRKTPSKRPVREGRNVKAAKLEIEYEIENETSQRGSVYS